MLGPERVFIYVLRLPHRGLQLLSAGNLRRVRWWWDFSFMPRTAGDWCSDLSVSNALIEDNIFYRQTPGVECDAASSGNAFLYNFSDQALWTQGATEQEYSFDGNHAPHGNMNLYEGNYGNNFINDGYHGSGSHFTIFRNRFHGYDETGDTINSRCIDLCRWSLYNTVVGNVLGTSGFSNVYDEKTNGFSMDTDHFIYRFGYPNLGNSGFSGYRPTLTLAQDKAQSMEALDEAVRPTSEWSKGGSTFPAGTAGTVQGTTFVEGNWDAVNNKVMWNTIPAQAIPNSLYYPSKPAYFGSLAWPPFDPNNPGSNNSPSSIPSGGAAIPAGYRYIYNTQ